MRTLIIGGTGTLGSAVAAACDLRHHPHVTTSYRGAAGSTPIDARDGDAVRELIADYLPETTVYAAPLESLDGFANVVQAVSESGGVLVFFSSVVVNGLGRRVAKEDDPVRPECATGRLFATAEQLLKNSMPDRHLIVRTSDVFNAARFGSVGRLTHRLSRFEPVRANTENAIIPTYAPDLADVVLDLLERGHVGTFHTVGPERHTAFTFTRLVAHVFGYDADLVQNDRTVPTPSPQAIPDRTRLRSLLGASAIRRPADGLRAVRATLAEAHRLKVSQAA